MGSVDGLSVDTKKGMNMTTYAHSSMSRVDGAVACKLAIDANPDELFLSDPTRFYRYEIGQVDMLSAEKVMELARSIERGRLEQKRRPTRFVRGFREVPVQTHETCEAEDARRQLIEANLRLVLHIARKYRGFGVDLMDLIQEGNMGLMHAVEKFDYRKGYKFSTYATWWIRQYIARALAEQAHTIRVPLYKIDEMKRLARVRQHLQQGFASQPTLEVLAEQMEMSVQQVIALLATNQETISLDMPCKGGSDEVALSEILEDDPSYSPEGVLMKQTLHDQIQDLLNCLTQREREVLRLRYGLDGNREHSLTEAGKKVGLSHEAVRQIEFRALRKLDHPSRDRMLHDFLV